MKKTFLILVILAMVYSVFARGSSENTEQGTYIPFAMYEAVEATKSYSEGIALTSSKEYYTVLCVTENEILSDLKFHDAFQLSLSRQFLHLLIYYLLLDKNIVLGLLLNGLYI